MGSFLLNFVATLSSLTNASGYLETAPFPKFLFPKFVLLNRTCLSISTLLYPEDSRLALSGLMRLEIGTILSGLALLVISVKTLEFVFVTRSLFLLSTKNKLKTNPF